MQKKILEFINKNWENVIRENKADDGTLIGLPYRYTVPCVGGTFQELYYWDTYFTNIGLILSNRIELAKSNIDNMTHMISQYGFMPNGNRTFYLSRSQPPFLSQMVIEVYQYTKDKIWLKEKYEALKTEYSFWQRERITESGLNRYYGNFTSEEECTDLGKCLCMRFAITPPESHSMISKYGECMISFSESGWDCTSRFGMEANHYNGIDLNALLYGMENNMAYMAYELDIDEADIWEQRSKERKKLINKLLWNENIGVYSDYNFVTKRKESLISTATFYPLFVGLADPDKAALIRDSLNKIEQNYGVSCTENKDNLYDLQWDYPNGWACQQYIVIKGLLNYNYLDDALRLARKYKILVEQNFKTSGNIWEKYNVVTGKVSVNKEYETPPMMGWSAGVYLYCLELLKNTIN